jgi:hypothetical protein
MRLGSAKDTTSVQGDVIVANEGTSHDVLL